MHQSKKETGNTNDLKINKENNLTKFDFRRTARLLCSGGNLTQTYVTQSVLPSPNNVHPRTWDKIVSVGR